MVQEQVFRFDRRIKIEIHGVDGATPYLLATNQPDKTESKNFHDEIPEE